MGHVEGVKCMDFFYQKGIGVQAKIIKITAYFLEKWLVSINCPRRNISLKDVWHNYLDEFFDGVASSRVCGSGMLICRNPDDLYKFKWCSGVGTNTKAELLAFWGILYYSRWLDINKMDIFGDSKSTIYWVNKKTLNLREMI